jgi:hypothetical protein
MPVEEEVDTAVVGTDGQRPASQCLVDADSLPARHQSDRPAGRHPRFELDRGPLRRQNRAVRGPRWTTPALLLPVQEARHR